ncbi:hypothetical protein [Hyphomicrobium sp.]|uniref:hypothetical protein n=1 Tax=Hyphomicrobium sp. TaxID=82 RepID=UPI002FE41E0C
MTGLRWFRCVLDYWSSDDIASLDFATIGFLHLIRTKIIERGKPVEYEIILRMAHRHGSNRRTVDKMLAKLTKCGLIVRVGADFWCNDLAAEVEDRRVTSQKYRKSFAKVSRNMRRKTQQNGAFAVPEEEEEREGRPAGAPSEIQLNNTVGCATPSPSGEAFPMTAIDIANGEFGEAMQANYAALYAGHLAFDLEDVCGCNEEDYLGDDDVADVIDHEHAWISEGWDEGRGDAERRSKGND